MTRVLPSQVRSFIEQAFPGVWNQRDNVRSPVHIDRAGSLAGLLRLLDHIPNELLTFNGDSAVRFFAGTEAIRCQVDNWRSRGAVGSLTRIPGFGDLNPVTLIYRTLAECPDEAFNHDGDRFAFIEDLPFRSRLNEDAEAIENALIFGSWKAVTVLGGSLAEALLLWRIVQLDINQREQGVLAAVEQNLLERRPGNDINAWGLGEYAAVTRALGLIEDDTYRQIQLAKDFRNLIHPGREQRLRINCDRGTALAAVAAVELLRREFND